MNIKQIMHCFPFLCCIKFCCGCLKSFFSFTGQKKWSLVALDRWSSNTVTIVSKLAWVDSELVVLEKWFSYRGGRLSRFDCRFIYRIISRLWELDFTVIFRGCRNQFFPPITVMGFAGYSISEIKGTSVTCLC